MRKCVLGVLTSLVMLLADVAVAQNPQGVNVVFIGNSITYGACLSDRANDAPPAVVKRELEQRGVCAVSVANLGKSGSTTVDWLPSTNTLFKGAVETADKYAVESKPLIFSISLGTNDSAIEGTNGAPLSGEAYGKNLYIIVDTLMKRYPKSSIIVNYPIWYSPNTYNGAKYLVEGQKRLQSYAKVIDDVVWKRNRAKDRGRIYEGNKDVWMLFRQHADDWFVKENGQAGTFLLHPNVRGAQQLGKIWAETIYDVWRHESPEVVTLKSGAQLLVYKPTSGKAKKGIVVCPGGGYTFLAADHEGTRMAHWFSRNDMAAVVLLYRMPKGDHTIPLTDAAEAIEYMRKHSDELGGYKQVGIMGSSAGGHLASTAATHLDKNRGVDFHILLYPVVTMELGVTHKGSHDNLLGADATPELERRFSNELRVTPETSRAFIYLAADDKTVPAENSLRYVRALLENKVPCTLHMYPTGGHGWGWSDGYFYKKQWASELLRWLEQF
jgi:acetyl esterase/lipase